MGRSIEITAMIFNSVNCMDKCMEQRIEQPIEPKITYGKKIILISNNKFLQEIAALRKIVA